MPLPSLLLLAVLPAASSSAVRDEAGYFRPETAREATERIEDIRRRSGKGLVVETVAAVPAAREKELNSQGRKEFFVLWAEERAAAAGVEGIYVLICRKPDYIQVYVDPDTREQVSSRDAENLRKLLVQRFNHKHYDEGLLDGVALVREQLDPRRRASGRPDWLWMGGAVLGILALWLVLGAVRRRLPEQGPEESNERPADADEEVEAPADALTLTGPPQPDQAADGAAPEGAPLGDTTLTYHSPEQSPG